MAKITKIEPQKNKYDRVNIYLDDEFFCAMQNFICVKHGLKMGLNVDKERLVELVYESDKEKALNKTAKYLSKGIKTEKQILDYLTKNGFDGLISRYVLEKLKEYKYVDDASFVRHYINTYAGKYGKQKLVYELKLKGIAQEVITSAFSDYKSDEDAVLELAKKYLKNKEIDYKNLQKLSQYLAGKGFMWNEIQAAVNKFKKNFNDES